MVIIANCGGRIIHVEDESKPNLNIIIDPVPPNYQALFCRSCKVGYTTPVVGSQTS